MELDAKVVTVGPIARRSKISMIGAIQPVETTQMDRDTLGVLEKEVEKVNILWEAECNVVLIGHVTDHVAFETESKHYGKCLHDLVNGHYKKSSDCFKYSFLS